MRGSRGMIPGRSLTRMFMKCNVRACEEYFFFIRQSRRKRKIGRGGKEKTPLFSLLMHQAHTSIHNRSS